MVFPLQEGCVLDQSYLLLWRFSDVFFVFRVFLLLCSLREPVALGNKQTSRPPLTQ